jgi:hypothetical protein
MLSRYISQFAAALLMAVSLPLVASASDSEDLSRVETLLEQASMSGSLSDSDASVIGEALSAALHSDHRGLESAALRLVITYGEAVRLDGTTMLQVVRIYRDHEDQRMRRMAIVAIGASGDTWAKDFLARSLPFEGSSKLRHTIRAVIAA